MEKPLCHSVKEGTELVALAKKNDRILMVGYLLWYHSAVLKLKELIWAGELGRIQYIYLNRLNFGKIRREENIFWSFAPHDISVMLGLLIESPDGVRAQGGGLAPPAHRGCYDQSSLISKRGEGPYLRLMAPSLQRAETDRSGRSQNGGI